MSRLLQLLALLIKTYPDARFGQLLLSMMPSHVDLWHMPDQTLELFITNALREGLTPRVRRVVMPIGLPGSGKSTYVSELISNRGEHERTYVICSTDDLFMKDGKYQFNPGKLSEYHARNFQKFALALADATDLVIVDNTNLREEHREPYIRLAKAMGYEVQEDVIGSFNEEDFELYARRNLHGVPLEGIKRMAASVQLPHR